MRSSDWSSDVCSSDLAVKPNPVGKNVDDGVAAYKAGGHDGIIAFGGGSGLDCAKAIALMAGQKRPLFDFEDKGDNWKRVDPEGVAPIVAVPTPAGPGPEGETERASCRGSGWQGGSDPVVAGSLKKKIHII